MLLVSFLLFAVAGRAAPPPLLDLDVTHTVLQVYDTDDGPATEVELTITNTGSSELYDFILDFDLNAPPPPNRGQESDNLVRVRTLPAGETVIVVWVLALRTPVPTQHPLFAAVRAVSTATQQPIEGTLISMAGGAQR